MVQGTFAAHVNLNKDQTVDPFSLSNKYVDWPNSDSLIIKGNRFYGIAGPVDNATNYDLSTSPNLYTYNIELNYNGTDTKQWFRWSKKVAGVWEEVYFFSTELHFYQPIFILATN